MNDRLGAKHIMVIIAGCGMVGTTIGLFLNIAGLFFIPIAKELNVGQGIVALALTAYNLMHAFNGTVVPKYIERLGFKKTVILASILQIAATYLTSLALNMTHLIILNLIRGFASGMISMVTATLMINYWFNRNSSLVVSIVMCSAGVAGAIMSPVLSSFIGAYGWRKAYVLLALLALLFDLPSILFPIDIRPELVNEKPYGEAAETEKSETMSSSYPKYVFYLLFIFTLIAAFVTAAPQYFSGMTENYGLAGIGVLMMSVAMFVNSAGKLLLGAMIGRMGNRLSVSLYVILLFVGNLMVILCKGKGLLLIASAFYGLCYSLTTVATASMCRENIGMAAYGKVYPKVALANTLGNAIANYLIGFSYDLSGSYRPSLIVLQFLIPVMLVMIYLLYHQKKRTR